MNMVLIPNSSSKENINIDFTVIEAPRFDEIEKYFILIDKEMKASEFYKDLEIMLTSKYDLLQLNGIIVYYNEKNERERNFLFTNFDLVDTIGFKNIFEKIVLDVFVFSQNIGNVYYYLTKEASVLYKTELLFN